MRSVIQIIIFSLLSWLHVSCGPFDVSWSLLLAAWRRLLGETRIKLSSELLKFLQIHAGNRLSCCSQRLFKMLSCNFWNWVKVLRLSALLDQCLHSYFSFDWLLLNKKNTSLTPAFAAFWQISVKSAPENPSVMLAIKVKSTSLASGVFLKLAFKMLSLDGWSGKGM